MSGFSPPPFRYRGARVGKTANQNLTVTFPELVTWAATAAYDTDGFYDSVNHRFVIPAGLGDRYVRVGVSATVFRDAPDQTILFLRQNNVDVHSVYDIHNLNTNQTLLLVHEPVYVAEGDYFTVFGQRITTSMTTFLGDIGAGFWLSYLE